MPDVADLLRRSRAANTAFHTLDRKRHPERWDALREKIVEARALRLDAHAADPEHADPAWAEDKAPHAEILAFYDRYLGTP